ncbi:MAG: hypothetical protein ABFD79_12465 [Phycisphaerales bacterium]
MQPKDNEKKFDEMLKCGLKNHCEPINDDFARQLYAKVEKIQQQQILNRIIIQERTSLAAFMLLPLLVLATMFAFPFLITAAGHSIANICISLIESLNVFFQHWKLFCYYSMVILFCLFAAYQMLKTER